MGEKPVMEREEGREGGREWDESRRDERARGKYAVPMVHQKLMPTTSV